MTKANIGGAAKTVTVTLAELKESQDRVFQLGIDSGLDLARRELREEIRQELQDELAAFDPDCPMCNMTRELEDLRHMLDVTAGDRDVIAAQRRGWIIRSGSRPYFETR